MVKVLTALLLAVFALNLNGQTLTWQGSADSDFYNELNWLIEGTEDNPADGSIEPNEPIDFNLIISGLSPSIPEDAILEFTSPDKELKIENATLAIDQFVTGIISLDQQASLILHASTPLTTQASIDLVDHLSWIKLLNVKTVEAGESYLNLITANGQLANLNDNVFINQYYYKGSLIRLKDNSLPVLTLYDGTNQTGEAFGIGSFDIYSDEELGDFENKASSFRLERGYVATMTIFQNGTGKSEVYVASEEALEMDLPAALNNTVSFVRVVPWNWVTKKGASKFLDIGTTWTYNWNRTGESLPNIEYAPMAWGYGGAQLGVIEEYLAKENVTHLMGFNESDNCNDQSGQYNDLCQIEVAVPTFKNLMRAGLRLVSPSPRENGPLPGRWLSQFRDLAVETDVRYDVLGVHWYDWANGPVDSPFADPTEVFERFKNYLDRVYEEHGMPIWITEFNANANRDVSVHLEFLKLALPYLESLDFIERYDYFEPNPDVANNRDDITFASFYDENGALTELGLFYRDFESTPSIPEATYSGSQLLSDLEGKVELTMEVDKNEIAEGESLMITLFTSRSVGADESFEINIDLDEEQYVLDAEVAEFAEGTSSIEVTLTAVDDDLEEETLMGTISLSNLSSGIEWTGDPISFTMTSEDEEIVLPPLGLADGTLISLYPNPTARYISVSNESEIETLNVISTDGRLIDDLAIQDGRIDLKDLSAGIYVIRIGVIDGSVQSFVVKKN